MGIGVLSIWQLFILLTIVVLRFATEEPKSSDGYLVLATKGFEKITQFNQSKMIRSFSLK